MFIRELFTFIEELIAEDPACFVIIILLILGLGSLLAWLTDFLEPRELPYLFFFVTHFCFKESGIIQELAICALFIFTAWMILRLIVMWIDKIIEAIKNNKLS
jgi:hypothetical protein